MGCDLDKGPEIVPIYGEYPDFWAATCRTCKVPMLWTKECSMETPPDVLERMRSKAEGIGEKVYGIGNFIIDENQRQIPFHRHIHVRQQGIIRRLSNVSG